MTRRLTLDEDGLRRSMARAAARSGALLWEACCAGREPAESLDWRDREDLVAALADLGWSTVQIAAWTRMSTYTTARIRGRVAGRAVEQEQAA